MNQNEERIAILLSQLKETMPYFMRMEKLNLLRDLCKKENKEEILKATCKGQIKLINAHMKDLKDDEKLKAYNFLRDAHTDNGRYDLESYLIAMEWDRKPEKRFYQPRMKVLHPVMKDLQDLGDGVIDIYLLSMPPRVGKSTLGLFFMSWLAGRYPNEHIFGSGYASGLVNTFCKGVLDFIDSEEYRFYDIFPEARGKLTTSAKDMTIDIWEDERYKTLTFRSIDGQITGALEAESLLYLDDMCSGIEEAMNIDRLEKLWSKVTVDLMQRRVKNKRTGRLAPILGIGTIWSVHDPISRLERKYGKTSRFRSRKMPALNLDGESNFDYDYNVGYSTEMYLELKSNMDEVSWECVYQQNPMERDGLLFPATELRRYLSLPNTKPDAVIAHCDVAFGGDDFINFPVGYVYGEDCYVVDTVFRCKADYKVTEPMVAGKIVQHEVQMAHFEADRGGDFYARDVDDMVKKSSKHRCNITWSSAGTKQSKLVRIIQYAPDIKRMYFKDPSLYKPTDDYGRMMSNVTTFVQTGSSLHDDGPDGLAGLAKLFKQPMIGAVSSPIKRPF